jgi:hypothetical protein
MKVMAIVIVSLIIIVCVAAGVTWGVRYIAAPIEGSISAREQILSGEQRIVAYNHFYDLKAAIDSYPAQIEAQEEALTRAVSDKEKARINANIAGMKAQLVRLINQYNADAKKKYTIGQFRDLGLPYGIDLPK